MLTSPVFREIKRCFPQSHVTLLTSTDFGNVLANNPHIDHTIQHPRKESREELRQLIEQLRLQSFDLIYDIHSSLRSQWIGWQLKRQGQPKPQLWKINKKEWKRTLLIRWKIKLLPSDLSARNIFLEPLQQRTSFPLNNHTELFPSDTNRANVQKLMVERGLKNDGFLCIGPSASFANKCWPLEHYQTLIEALLKLKQTVVIVGGKNEEEPTKLETLFGDKIHNLAGLFSPLESAVLLEKSRVAICNDTSIGHLAEAMGTPALTLFGPTVRELGYAPFQEKSVLIEKELACRPCTRNGKDPCKHEQKNLCLTSIAPEEVLSHAKPLLTLEKINAS